MGLQAQVKNGRIVLDEPTTLEEGTILNLVAEDGGDDLTEEELQALDKALAESWASIQAGQGRPASEILSELRKKSPEVVNDDCGDDLTEEDRRALHETLAASLESAKAGRVRPASEVLTGLHKRR